MDSRIAEWTGPFTLLSTDEDKRKVFIQDAKIGQARAISLAQAKRYKSPEHLS